MTPCRSQNRRRLSGQPAQPLSLQGATLTEVLMSMLIFSIGVVSIFSLFPISIVRSIRATQLTNSKLFEKNFQQLVRMNPEILTAHVPATAASAVATGTAGNRWQPQYMYNAAVDVVVPGARTSGLLPEPFALFVPAPSPPLTVPTPPNTRSGLVGPAWQLPAQYTFPDNSVSPQSFLQNTPPTADALDPITTGRFVWLATAGHRANLNARGYVVDPLGFWTVFSDNGGGNGLSFTSGPVQLASQFGKRADRTGAAGVNLNDSSLNSVPGWGPVSTTHLPRINGAVGLPVTGGPPVAVRVEDNIAAARRVASYMDTWTVDYAGAAMNVSAVAVQLPPNTPISGNISGNVNMRVVLRTAEGRATTRTVTGVSMSGTSPVLNWSPSQPLPDRTATPTTSIAIQDITDVRLESYDARYTWLATVNNRVPGRPKINVAVYFNRKFTPGEEHVYKAVFGNAMDTYGIAYDNSQDSDDLSLVPAARFASSGAGGLNADQVLIAWDSATEPTPTFSEGNYIFDAVNVDWYRIVDAARPVATSLTKKYVILSLDRAVMVPTPPFTATTGLVGRAMVPRGIVKLFEL